MNMRALLLHVLGDALGNVGVIATGLIIWLTSWSFKYYCDPIISLVITAIIFHSALPLGESLPLILGAVLTRPTQSVVHPSSCSRASPQKSRWKMSDPRSLPSRVCSRFTNCTYGSSRKPRSSPLFILMLLVKSNSCRLRPIFGGSYTSTEYIRARYNPSIIRITPFQKKHRKYVIRQSVKVLLAEFTAFTAHELSYTMSAR